MPAVAIFDVRSARLRTATGFYCAQVTNIEFNPTADNVMLSVGYDNLVKVGFPPKPSSTSRL